MARLESDPFREAYIDKMIKILHEDGCVVPGKKERMKGWIRTIILDAQGKPAGEDVKIDGADTENDDFTEV